MNKNIIILSLMLSTISIGLVLSSLENENGEDTDAVGITQLTIPDPMVNMGYDEYIAEGTPNYWMDEQNVDDGTSNGVLSITSPNGAYPEYQKKSVLGYMFNSSKKIVSLKISLYASNGECTYFVVTNNDGEFGGVGGSPIYQETTNYYFDNKIFIYTYSMRQIIIQITGNADACYATVDELDILSEN